MKNTLRLLSIMLVSFWILSLTSGCVVKNDLNDKEPAQTVATENFNQDSTESENDTVEKEDETTDAFSELSTENDIQVEEDEATGDSIYTTEETNPPTEYIPAETEPVEPEQPETIPTDAGIENDTGGSGDEGSAGDAEEM